MNYSKNDTNKYNFLKSKYVDKVPVIVDCTLLKEKKYLVPANFTFGQLLYFLRKRVTGLQPSEALYIYVKRNNTDIIPITHELVTKYEYGNFVFITLKKENTFG